MKKSASGNKNIKLTKSLAETPCRTILEVMNEGAVIVSNEGLILYCNRRFSEFVCVSQEQVAGADIRTFVAGEDRAWFSELLHKSLIERTTGVVSCLTGKNAAVRAKLSFVALSQEINSDLCIVISDITEIKNYQNFLEQIDDRSAAELEETNRKLSDNLAKLEKSRKTLEASSKKYKILYNRMRESEDKYRLLFEKMGEGFALHEIILDDSGEPCDYRFLNANPSFEKQTGLKVENIIGKRITEILPSIEKYWIMVYGDVALSGKSREFENYSAPLNKYFRVSAFCPQPGQFAAVFEDITDRKLAENELKESREKLEIALESGHIGVWEWDLKTNKVKWDERMEKIFSIDSGSFQGNHTAMEALIHEEDLPHFHKAIVNSVDTGSLFETIIRTRLLKGNPKHISTKALVNKDPYGNPVSLTGVCFDVTAMKKGAEKVIFKLNEELLRSNKELESFAYVASHDLQEPLRMVSSFTQLLEQKYRDKLDQDAHDYINFAVDGATRMYELINGLLAYSRVQTKGKEFARVNMAEVFDKVNRNLSLKINERHAVITKNHLPEIYADESQMIQLVQNLFENSIKFSSGTPRVHFS
ncbi:MAG: PAS domain S-box protein [Bacteroidales bacterium]